MVTRLSGPRRPPLDQLTRAEERLAGGEWLADALQEQGFDADAGAVADEL